MIIEDGTLVQVEESDIVDGFLRIPDGVTYVSFDAIPDENDIRKIYIPKSLTEIHYGTFANCKKLEHLEFDDNITFIPEYSFPSLSMTSVKLPSHLKTVGGGAFSASKLERIVFPDSVEELGSALFNSCSNLKSVVLPKNLEVIENLQEIEDAEEIFESIEDIWPDYPSKDDFFFNEDEY